MKPYPVIGWIVCFCGAVNAAHAQGGLRMNYSRIAVDNLPIGHAVSMKRLANLPLKVGNNYDFPIEVQVSIRYPATLRPDYEPVPDTNWVRPEWHAVEVEPGAEREMDMVIMLPDDEGLHGRRFQADVHVLTVGKRGVRGVRTGYEITGNLLFSVAPERNDVALHAALENPADGAFVLDPPRVDVFGAAPGLLMPILARGKNPVRLVNGSSETQTYEFEAVPLERSAYNADFGSQPMDPRGLLLPMSSCTLNSSGGTNLEFAVQVPADADFGKGPLLYLVAVRNGVLRSVEQYLKVYLWPGAEPENEHIN
jgi:hypothetical protein